MKGVTPSWSFWDNPLAKLLSLFTIVPPLNSTVPPLVANSPPSVPVLITLFVPSKLTFASAPSANAANPLIVTFPVIVTFEPTGFANNVPVVSSFI